MAGSPLGATPAIPLSAHQAATEAAILQALPHDLVQVLTGPAVVCQFKGAGTYERACLLAAHEALRAEVPDLGTALGHLGAGLAQAIRPDGITPRPETVLLQAAFWLLQHETQGAELIGRAADGTSTAARHDGGAA